MEEQIKKLEDMSLNAWPSHQMELYDGWILRFSYFYTHRTNSVEQFGTSTLPWREKIPYCESVYRRWGTPAIFKISPLVSKDFDYVLENRGYEIQHVTNVMTVDLNQADLSCPCPDTEVKARIPSYWIEGLLNLKKTTNETHRLIVPSMYRAIPKDTICVCIYCLCSETVGKGQCVVTAGQISSSRCRNRKSSVQVRSLHIYCVG